MKFERRFISGSGIEIRANGDGKMPTVRAYALLYGQLSVNLGHRNDPWFEIIERGAVKDCIADLNHEIVGLKNHNDDWTLGRRSAGTLRVGEDDQGVWFECELPDTTWGRDLVVQLQRGDIKGCSFAFEVLTQKWEIQDGKEIRRLIKINISDVSLVTNPAYPSTNGTVSMRSLTATARDFAEQDYAEIRKSAQIEAPDTESTLNYRMRMLRLKEKAYEFLG